MSEQLFLEAFNSEPYFFEKEEKYGAMDIIYTFEDEAGHGFKFHFEKKVALGKHAYVCVLSQKTPGLKTYKRVIGKFSNPMRTVATLLAVVRDIHDTRKDVHGIVMSIPEQAFGSYSRLVKKIMTRELRTVLNVEDGEYTPEDFEKMGLVGIVTTVKPRNMNTVYTGPALKEYQERQAAKDGAGVSAPTAVVPGAKVSNVILSAKASINKTGAKIVFEAGSLVQGFDNSDLKAAAQNIASKYQSVTPFVETSGVGFTSKNVLDTLKAANELSSVAEGNGYQIKVTAEGALSSIGFKLSELKVKFSLTGLDASNVKLTYTENGESVKLLALSLGWSAIGGNGSYSLMSYNGDIEQLRSSLKEYGTEEKAPAAVKKPDFAAPVQVEFNVHAPDGRTLTLTVDHLSGVSTKDSDGNFVSEKVIKNGDTRIITSAMREYTNVAKMMPLIQMSLNDGYTVASVPQYRGKVASKGITELNKPDGPIDLPKQTSVAQTMPVVDPVAEREAFYFDYDHRQITLTYDNAETAGRVKDQLLELGAATFNGSEFFTDKEKLILVDDKSLDVKKVQETLFPILGQPLMLNGVFVDPNIRSSVRSPDGVIYRIKGNTIQVEDAPKDSAMTIVRELIPMADRIFDDKGSNTLELNEQGIADGFAIHNIAPVLKKSNLSTRLSAKLFRSWKSAVTEAINKYDLSTGDLGSSFTNNATYLINAATSGVVGEYLRTDGNVISGIVLYTNYMIREAVAKPLVALGFTVEYDVQGWRTQVKLPVNSDYTIPGTSELAVFIKEVDNLANVARNRSIIEYVGGNKNFKARWNPGDSRAFLILPTEESSGLGWRDYTAYATAPNYVRVDNIESYEDFLKLSEFAKNFDFGANLLRNIGVSKYLSDVRSGGAKASKSYKLKDGGEVEISFKLGDMVTIIFNQNSEGFDKEMSEFASEKMEIFGRASVISLYKLGTADANKTLKNIDAWLDAHIVSKEDNASSVSLILNAGFSSGNDYSASVVGGVLQIHDQREGVVASLSGINLDGVPAVVLSGVELHIREPEFKKASFQGVVVDKTVSVDNVKFVIKKADGTLIGRIELNSSTETPISSKEDNSSKGNAKSTEALIDQEIESKKSWAEDILRESLSHNTSGQTVAKVEYVGTSRPTKNHVLYIFKLLVQPKFGAPVAQKAFVKGTIGLDVITGYTGTGQNRQPMIKPVSITLDRSVTSWVGYDYDPKVADQYEKDMTFDVKLDASKADFKYGDKVIVNNARSYNSMATSDKVEGVVELVSGGRVYVKIGTGQSIVDPKDVQKVVGATSSDKKVKPPKIERKKVNDSQYDVLIDGVIEGRISKTTSKGKATWAIYHDKSGIQIYGYLSAPTLFDDFKKQYLQWFEKQGAVTPQPKPKLFNDLTIKLKKQGNLPQLTINVKGDDVFITQLAPSGMHQTESRDLAFLMDSNPAYGSVASKNAEVKRRLLQLVGATKSRIESEISSWTNGLQQVESISGNIGTEVSKVSVPPAAPKSKNIVKPLISAIESVAKDGKEKKVTGFDLRVGETWAYDGHRGEMNNLLFISGPESTSLDSKIRSLGGAVLLRGVTRVGDLTIEFEDVAKKRKSKLTFTCGGLVQGSFESLKGSFSPATKSKVDKLISKMFTDSPQAIANEFADFIGNPDLRYKIVKDARKPAILISKNPAGFKEALADAELLLESQLDEGIKEDLTGKAPNRVKRELLEATLKKLGLYRESFTYGNATFKTVVNECSVEIVPTTGNIRNFAKMLGARLGQELRIDDEGFLSFDLDNI